MPTHSSILAWRIPWTEEPGYSPGATESDTTEQLTLSLQFQRMCKLHSCIFVKWVQSVSGIIVLSAPRSDPSSTVEEKSVCTLPSLKNRYGQNKHITRNSMPSVTTASNRHVQRCPYPRVESCHQEV